MALVKPYVNRVLVRGLFEMTQFYTATKADFSYIFLETILLWVKKSTKTEPEKYINLRNTKTIL